MGPDSNSALSYGGLTSTDLANTEVWNGTSWTELNDMGFGNNIHQFNGNEMDGIFKMFFGGMDPFQNVNSNVKIFVQH